MFTTRTKEEYRKELIQFSADEVNKLNDYVHFIKQLNAGKKAKELALLLKNLKPCSPSEIYKFSETSETFKDFCLRKDFPMTKKWADYLNKKGYLGEPVVSIDRELKHSIFDQYRGAYLYSNYLDLTKKSEHSTALLALDLACDQCLFQALTERCELNKEKIKNINIRAGEKDWILAIGQLLADIKTLGNLYGTIGYLHSALVLLDIGIHLSIKNNREGGAAVGMEFLRGAVESFFMAKLLAEEELPENQKVIRAISKDQGLALYKFRDWTAAENFIWDEIDKPKDKAGRKLIDRKMINRDSLQKSAKEDVDLLLAPKKEYTG